MLQEEITHLQFHIQVVQKDFKDKNSYGGVNDEIKTFVPNIGVKILNNKGKS